MFDSRYSDIEMQQWDDACNQCAAPRPRTSRISVAKGQNEPSAARGGAQRTGSRNQAARTAPPQPDSASECLFDWYNS